MCKNAVTNSHEITVRSNIDTDDRVMADATVVSGLTAKRETVESALRLPERRKYQADVRSLFGTVSWYGDLDAGRRDTPL